MGLLDKVFGSKVKVPKFKEIDPDAEIQKAFDSIQEQLPEAQRITKNIGEADADTAMAVLEKIAPGTTENLRLQTKNIQAGLRGELPEDVRNLIIDRSAIQSQFGGYSGSQAAGYNQLRNLGLTSLDVIDRASNQAAQALQQYSSMVPRMSVSSMFLMPSQKLAFAQGERNQQYQRDYAAAQERAKANPIASGLFNAAVSVGGAALGGFMGGKALGAAGGAAAGAAGSAAAGAVGGAAGSAIGPALAPKQGFLGFGSPDTYRVTPDSYSTNYQGMMGLR